MSPALSIVSDQDPKTPNAETVAERIRRLQAEAKALARAHISAVVADLDRVTASAQEIAAGGECYPDGVRQELEQLAREIERRVATINAIVGRVL